MSIKEQPCHPDNYRKGRKQAVRYLVVHYVGAKGDAANNAKYYGSTSGINASAHYFVGHGPSPEIWASVAENNTAWHVGAQRYVHPDCRNENAIGVELCCHQDTAGAWYFDPETVDVAVELCRNIVGRYDIPRNRVLRHYDVTGKICPAPFVHDANAWEDFKDRLFAPAWSDDRAPTTREDENMDVNHFKELWAEMRNEWRDNDADAWSADARQWAVSTGLIQGGTPMPNGETNYMWDDLLTRQQIAMLLYRFAKMIGAA